MKKLISALSCLLLAVAVQARTITVDDDYPADFDNIQAAINDANNGDTVEVQPGTYTGTGNRDIDFLGKAITVKSENGPESCIIDAEHLGRVFLFYNGEGEDSIIDGFTITHGQLYCEPCEPCPISWYGGGICCGISVDASPTIRNCIITDNFAHFGGGIYIEGSPVIINCVLTGNEAQHGSAICGDGDIKIINCTIVGNTAGLYGDDPAVILLDDSMIVNSILWDNLPEQLLDLASSMVIYNDIQDGWPGTGNIDTDPCFVDPCSGDYHLSSGSPCIDAGDPNYVAGPNETDIDGDPRVWGGRVDMGVDEYECYAGMPDYDEWVEVGRPECWCYPRQCHGDADGQKEGVSVAGYHYVGQGDLDVMALGWLVKDPPWGSGILGLYVNGVPVACADFKHNKEGVIVAGYHRVGVTDLDEMSLYWMVKEPPRGSGVPPDCQPGNMEPTPPATEPGIEYEITPCDLGASAAEQSDETRFTVTVEGRYIHFEDMMVANCCPSQVWLEMEVDDNQITIYERETGGVCLCICDYPVTATLGPFNPGTYTLEVYEDWGGFIGSTIVIIE